MIDYWSSLPIVERRSVGAMAAGVRLLALLAVVAIVATAEPAGAGATRTTRRRAPARSTARPASSAVPRGATTTHRPTAPPTVTSAVAPTTTTTRVRGSITVLAASSLGAAFREIATAFERANPESSVVVSSAGSSTLTAQLRNGAPADVFASADVSNMDDVVGAGIASGSPTLFARNRLMIVVPKGNPMRVKELADLADPDVWVALGAPGVPVGDYARRALASAGIALKPRTLEPNAAAIVTKAVLHEIDAGIVYVTDVAHDDHRVDGIAIPDAQNVIATYPIVPVTTGSNLAGGVAFVAFVRSPAGQATLRRYKFLAPAVS